MFQLAQLKLSVKVFLIAINYKSCWDNSFVLKNSCFSIPETITLSIKMSCLQKGGIVRLFLTGTLFLFLSAVCTAAPIIQKIVNDTDFAFLILDHSDTSECSLKDKNMIIQPRTIFNYEF